MTWEFVLGIFTLVGLMIAIVKPIITLTNAITLLNSNLENLANQFQEFDVSNSESHRRLWAYNEKQDSLLQTHERRIHDLDGL